MHAPRIPQIQTLSTHQEDVRLHPLGVQVVLHHGRLGLVAAVVAANDLAVELGNLCSARQRQ